MLKAVPYLSDDKNANAKRLGVSNEQVNVFTAQQSAQDTVYSAYSGPDKPMCFSCMSVFMPQALECLRHCALRGYGFLHISLCSCSHL